MPKPSRTTAPAPGASARQRFERVQHLVAGGHDGVVLDALVIVVRLLEREVDLAADGPGRLARVALAAIRAARGAHRDELARAEVPQPLQEPVAALARPRPTTPASSSGGDANITKWRAVSAP